MNRILELFDGLKFYFQSQDHCPTLIQNFFKDNFCQVYLYFVQGQLKLFNKCILEMYFIPEETKKLLLKLENDGIDCKKNQLGVQKFSQTFN